MATQSQEFGFIRSKFFPVHKREQKKIVPLIFLFFFITLNYGILRALKDTFILSRGGAKLLSQVKLFGVIPMMMVFKFAYDTVSKKTNRNGRIYTLIGFFTSFLLLFVFVLKHFVSDVPLTPDMSLWVMFKHIWPLITFYIIAESYGSFMLSVACWGVVIEITSHEQARRCYSVFSIGTAIATLLAGSCARSFSEDTLIYIVLLSSILLAGVFFFFTRAMDKDPVGFEIPEKKVKKKKKKLGIIASFKAIFTAENSTYIGLIFCLVFCYASGIVLFEAVYKDWMKNIASLKGIDPKEFVKDMTGFQLQCIGISSLLIVLFIAGIVNRRKWIFRAMIVPSILLIGSVGFFGIVFCKDYLMHFTGWDELKASEVAMYIGLGVVVIVKSSKYVFFDATKESTYLALSDEEKITVKSSVDGLGARIGKGNGAITVTLLTWCMGVGVLDITGMLGCIIFIIGFIWIFAVINLSKRYSKFVKANEERTDKKEVQSKKSQ